MSDAPEDHWEKFQSLRLAGKPFVVVTLVDALGSTPQDVGAKMIVDESGLISGTVGGGRIEQAAIEYARAMIQESRSFQLKEWNLQKDIGMTCGGIVKMFFEQIRSPLWHIAIFGSGHVANALIPGLLRLNCAITCVDSRPEWLARISDSPKLKKIVLEYPKDHVASLPGNAFVLLMSQGHATDFPVLLECLKSREFPYLGVIGSKTKRATLIRELREAGISAERSEQFYCPIGLPIGSNSPEEISVSVMAQLLEKRDALIPG